MIRLKVLHKNLPRIAWNLPLLRHLVDTLSGVKQTHDWTSYWQRWGKIEIHLSFDKLQKLDNTECGFELSLKPIIENSMQPSMDSDNIHFSLGTHGTSR